jgi:hypothetical protein
VALVANLTLVGLSLSLGLRLLRHYLTRPRIHTLCYALGILLTAVAAFPELFHELVGGLPTPIWWLYWMSASTLVGLLGAGTSYLISPRLGKAAMAGVILLTAWVVVTTIATAGPTPADFTAAAFQHAPTGAVKLPFVLQNALGSVVILGGALYSFYRTRAVYNILIAAGTLIFASGGSMAGMHLPGIFYFTQTLGIIILYLGVSQSLAPRQSKPVAG